MDAGNAHPKGRGVRWAAWAPAAAVWPALPGGAGAAERVALAIGNGAYEKAPFLADPRNDARNVGAASRDFERRRASP